MAMRLSPALVLALVLSANADPLESVSLSFTRRTDKHGRRETTTGRIYHEGKRTTVVAGQPLEQWMVIEDGRMTVYYPGENRAIEITADRRAALPFFDFFLATALRDFGLPASGYTLDRSEVREGTLYTHWEPPRRLARVAGTLVLALRDDRVVHSESRDPGGKTLTRTTYAGHVEHADAHFPLVMKAEHIDDGKVVGTSEVEYSEPVFDAALPEEVKEFAVPADARVEKVRW